VRLPWGYSAFVLRPSLMDDTTNAIAVLAVDDHPLFIEGIAAVIGMASDIRLVGSAASGADALLQYRALRPDVVLMDLRLRDMNGILAIEALHQEFPGARIIVLTSHTGDRLAHRALTSGASAYLLKDNAHEELLDTIRAVHRGRVAIDPTVAQDLAHHVSDAVLTGRELDVLTLIAEGNSNRAVAETLRIQEETVKGHVKSILAKLGARDRTHAVTLALRRGIIGL
jgi:DNA-binding NarL/FixJ family response regulator